MVVVSYSGKEINAKLVYYGAGLSGKTTNLESIYEAVPDSSRGKMVSMKTQSDRTLFFDLLPLDLGEIMGFKTRFLLYTVPGQVFYNATRKLVLKGADAIVFVADSEVGKMDENKESLANLRANLIEYDLKLEEIPWVIQYNKRDLSNVYSLEELNAELNPGGVVPTFEAVATQGKGVFETFRGISHLLMEKVTRELRRAPMSGSRAARIEDGGVRPASASSAMPSPAPPAIAFGPASPVTPAAAPAPGPVASSPSAPPPGPPPLPVRPAPAPAIANGSDAAPRPASAETRGFSTGPMRSDAGAPNEYGRELALPPTGGPATPAAPAPAPDDLHARPFESRRRAEAEIEEPIPFEPPSVAPVTHGAPIASHSTPAPALAAPIASEPPFASPAAVGVLRETHAMPAVETHSTPARFGVGAPSDEASAAAAEGTTELVVPVSIPRGATRELVLRIVITEDAA